MSTNPAHDPRSGELVAIAERVRLMAALRVLFAALALLVATQAVRSGDVSIAVFAAASVAYVAIGLAAQLAFRASRRVGLTVFGLVLLLDGVYLVWAMYATGGSGSPVRFLIVVQVMAVALLASYRTGVKVAAWDSLLLLVVYYAREGHLLRPLGRGEITPGTPFFQLAGFTAVLWLAAMATAHFSAVNERELRRRRYDIEALARMAEALELTRGSAPTAAVLLEHAADAFEINRGLVLAARDGEPQLLASCGVDVQERERGAPGQHSVVTDAMRSRRTRLTSRLDQDDAFLAALLPDAQNLIVVPLTAEGRAVGALVVERTLRGGRVARRVVSMLERFAAYGSLALSNAWLLEQLQLMAATDGLTGLMNHAALHDALGRELARAARERRELTLVILDIDRFKAVNDLHGHQVGDQVLRRVARALDSATRGGGLLGRYGGEEFVVVLPEADRGKGIQAAERLRLAVAGAEGTPRITASLGVATFPVDGLDAAALLSGADRALYASKASGRDCVTAAGQVELPRAPAA